MSHRTENIVIFPFMAQGHIIPFLALALKIEQRGCYNITFVNTPLNIKKLKTSLPPSSSIRLREIPFNSSDHGLPPDSENTDVLPYTLIVSLLHASLSLKTPFKKFLENLTAEQGGTPPLCVISDIFFGWSADVTNELGIFHSIFSGAGGFGLACYHSMWLNLPHRTTTSAEFSLPDFPEAGKIHVTQLSASFLAADGEDPWSVFQRQNLPGWANSDGILFNTVEEIDKIGLSYFRRKIGRPIWPVGPILLSVDSRKVAGKCIDWLDTKPPSSVIYISFGSQNTISATHMMELAKALDSSRKNFIWVVRPPLGFDINAEFNPDQWLPENFRNHVEDENRGLIVEKWAPQMEILGHKSVGAFLTHCGWNSVLESLIGGVPLIGWPMAAEQFFNAKYLAEEVGVCLEVARGTNFMIRCEDIVERLVTVMGESGKGLKMREKACQVRDVIRDAIRDDDDDDEGSFNFKGSSVKAMDEFFNAALLMKEKKIKLGQNNK